MNENLAAAAAALGAPEAIVLRSAEARAKATGMSIDEVLAAWAGGGGSPPAAMSQESPPTSPPPVPATSAPAEATATEPVAPEPVAPETTPSAVPPPGPAAVGPPPGPAQVDLVGAGSYPVVVSVRTDQLKERTRSLVPRWLTSCLLVLPFAGLLYLGNASVAECGEASVLAVDRVTGLVENCDGSPFEGKGPGGGGTDYLALGQSIFLGEAVTGVNCSGCHGAQGGGGVGPALNGVLTTFGACADHEEWVSKGTLGFQAEGRETYGNGKTVGGGGTMPGFAASLSEEQIASVALFERVRFGGADEAAAMVDCGLAPAEGEEGGTSTTVPAGGEESPATTAPAP